MLSICISDKGLLIVDASVGKSSMNVKNCSRVVTDACNMGPEGFKDYNKVRDNLKMQLEELKIRDKKAYITIDSASIVFEELKVPLVDQKKRKINIKHYMAKYGAKASQYVADYRVNCVVKEGNRKYNAVSVIFVYARVISDISRLCKSLGISPIAMDVAQNASLKIINRCIKDQTCRFDREFILFDFKGDFITFYLYKDGIKQHTVNFEMTEKPETRKYFMELKSKIDVINDVADQLEMTPTNIYVTGEVMQIRWALQKLANVEEMNVNQLPMPKTAIKGIGNLKFNEYYAPIGTLLREVKVKKK